MTDPVSIEHLQHIFKDDNPFKEKLMSIFIRDSKKHIKNLEEAVKKSDDVAWYKISHAFSGTATSVGAFTLAREISASQNRKIDKTEVLKKTKTELNRVVNFIKKEILPKKF
jgi:hypothetical protein